MRRSVLKYLLALTALAGLVALAKSYLEKSGSRTEVAQMFFDDGSSVTLTGDSVRAQEFEDIAHKVLEIALADGRQGI